MLGCNLTLGQGAGGERRTGWVEKALEKTGGVAAKLGELLAKAGDKAIGLDAVVYSPNYPITANVYSSVKYANRDTNTYGKMSGRRGRLLQQFCDIDENGELVFKETPVRKTVLEDLRGTLCVLVPLTEVPTPQLLRRFKISTPDDCVRFFDEVIVPQMKSQYAFAQNQKNTPLKLRREFAPTRYGNPRYCKYIGFFVDNGCVTDNHLDGAKCRALCRNMGAERFLREVIFPYALQSKWEDTYAWMPVDQSAVDPKALEVYKRLATTDLLNLGPHGKNESVNESAPITTNDHGDLETPFRNFPEAFFGAMVYMMQNTNLKKSTVTFATDNQDNLIMLNGEVLNQSRTKSVDGSSFPKGVRVFINVANVSDDHVFDYTPFWKDERFAKLLDRKAPKKLYYRVITGDIAGYNFDVGLETERIERQSEGKVRKEKGLGTVEEFRDSYAKAHAGDTPKNQSFTVTIMRAEGSGKSMDDYFFFTGFGKSPLETDAKFGEPNEAEAEVVRESLNYEENGLGFSIWYNGATERSSSDRVLIPSRGASVKKDRAGRNVGTDERG